MYLFENITEIALGNVNSFVEVLSTVIKLSSRLYFLNWRYDFCKPIYYILLIECERRVTGVESAVDTQSRKCTTASDHQHLKHDCWDRATHLT